MKLKALLSALLVTALLFIPVALMEETSEPRLEDFERIFSEAVDEIVPEDSAILDDTNSSLFQGDELELDSLYENQSSLEGYDFADDNGKPEEESGFAVAEMYAANFNALGNDTAFTIRGKSIKASLVGNKNNCWTYANELYNNIWGTKFASDFAGSSGAGWNMLRELADTDRRLTAENLKEYVSAAELGSTLRITSCTSSCAQFNNDGLSCGHKGHSLIIVSKDNDGLTVIDNHRADGVNYSVNTRYYSWQGFINYWGSYTYIKYIKWPGAPVYTATPIASADNLKFTNVAYPKTYLMNSKGWDLSSGTLESNYDLQTLKSEIVSTSGKVISSYTRTISGKSYSIRNLDTYESSDNGVHFSWIKEAGDYIWILTAKDGGDRTLQLKMPFTAVTSGSTSTTSTSTASKEYVPEETKPTTHTHTPVTDVAVPATCETAGKTEGSHCSTCGQVITAQKSIPAKGHTSETVKGYASTCIKKGLSDGSKCSVCGKALKEQTELPLADHTPETVNGYASTCTSKGLSDGSKCSVCGKTLKEQTELPLAEHTPETVKGYASTCVKKGLSDGSKCSVCGKTLIEQTELPLAEHTPETVPGWPATYTSAGMTDGSRCSVCGEVLVAQEEIPMLGFHMTNNTTNNVIVGDVFRIVVDDRTVKSYKSSNKKVASVAKDGTVTAKKAGKAKITIKLKGKKKKLTLTVKVTDPTIPEYIKLDSSGILTVGAGDTLTLTATMNEEAISDIKWTTNKKRVATVKDGVVTFKKPGKVTITATTVRGKKKASVKFRVTK